MASHTWPLVEPQSLSRPSEVASLKLIVDSYLSVNSPCDSEEEEHLPPPHSPRLVQPRRVCDVHFSVPAGIKLICRSAAL